MTKLLDTLTRAIEKIILALFSVITVVLAASIVTRFVQGFLPQGVDIQLPWAEEVVKYALLWVCTLGAAMLVREKGHFALGFMTRLFPGSRALSIVSYVLSAAVALIMVWYGTLITLSMHAQRTPTLQVPKSYIEMILPIAGVLMLLFIAEGLVSLARGKKQP